MEMKEGQFALIRGWGGQTDAVEIGKVTPKLFKANPGRWRERQYRRTEAVAVFDGKEKAEQIAQALNGARGEMSARIRKAQVDFDERRAAARAAYDKTEHRILAQGIEAAKPARRETGSTEGESPVATPCAQGDL